MYEIGAHCAPHASMTSDMNYRLIEPACRVFLTLLALFAALPATPASPSTDSARQGLPTLAPLVNEVTPAVVNISVITRSPLEDNPLFRDPYFRRFFNLPDRQERREQASGSGVIVDAARSVNLFAGGDAHQLM
jgi:S1-C subfamily serine protease